MVATFAGHASPVMDVRLLPGKRPTYVSCDLDGHCHIWDARAEKPRRTLPHVGRPGRGIQIAGDAVWLLAADKTIAQIKNDRVDRELVGQLQQPTCWAISDDERWLATGDAMGSVSVWDLKQGELRRRFRGLPVDEWTPP